MGPPECDPRSGPLSLCIDPRSQESRCLTLGELCHWRLSLAFIVFDIESQARQATGGWEPPKINRDRQNVLFSMKD